LRVDIPNADGGTQTRRLQQIIAVKATLPDCEDYGRRAGPMEQGRRVDPWYLWVMFGKYLQGWPLAPDGCRL
jgi:hypothetical protein